MRTMSRKFPLNTHTTASLRRPNHGVLQGIPRSALAARARSIASTMVALWLGLLHPAMLLASCPLLQQRSDHGCCPREAPMPDCPASQCFTAPECGSLPAIEAKFTASVAVEPSGPVFPLVVESAAVPRVVQVARAERALYLKIRVLLI